MGNGAGSSRIVTYFHKNHKTHRFYSIMVSLISVVDAQRM